MRTKPDDSGKDLKTDRQGMLRSVKSRQESRKGIKLHLGPAEPEANPN